MGDVKPEAVVRIVHVGERIARLYPAHFPQLLQPMLPAVLRKLMDREVGGGGVCVSECAEGGGEMCV